MTALEALAAAALAALAVAFLVAMSGGVTSGGACRNDLGRTISWSGASCPAGYHNVNR